MTPNAIKQDVLAGQTVAGAMVFEFFSPGMSAILANAGCRFVLYDMEHTGLGFETLKWLFSSCRGLPIEPMVRVPRGEYTWLARALDLGARGVMIPMVETADQARSIVQACRYPPVGRRGAAFGFAQCDYQGGDVGQKIREANARTMVIAQIETEHGLANVDAIAAVEGVDVLWVGHFDLSNFMGIPGQFDDPRFDAAMRDVVRACCRHGKAAGFMATDAAWIRRAREMGYTMIAAGTDNGLLQQAITRMVGHIDEGRTP
jgi:2-dehydro-3-deoxyglucarate aldolase/4-hydroxy-2-oxoheptanedioate aldolase